MHTGQAIVFLQDWDERDVTTAEVVEQLRSELGTIPACARRRRSSAASCAAAASRCRSCSAGPTTRSSPAGATACSRAWRRTRAARRGFRLQGDAAADARRRSTSTAPPTSASRPRRSARTLETMMGSRRVTTFVEDGEEYDVLLQAEPQDRAAPADLENLYVRAGRERRAGAAVQPGDADRDRRAGHASTASTACARSRCRRASRRATRSARRSTDAEQAAAEELPDYAQLDYKGAVARIPDGRRRGAVHVRHGAADRLPGAGRAVRELHPPARDHADGAARGARRAARAAASPAARSTSSARSASSCWSASRRRTAS